MEMVFLSGEKRNNIFLLFDEIKFVAIKDKWENGDPWRSSGRHSRLLL